MRNFLKLKLGAAILSTLVFASACSDPEAEARKLFNQGMTLQQEDKTEEALANYRKVVELYPQTQTAVDANKLLLQAKSAKSVMDAVTRKALEPQRNNLKAILDMYRLETGSYPTTEQGLEALIRKPAGVSDWKGPYVRDPEGFSKLIPYFEYEAPMGSGPPTLNISH